MECSDRSGEIASFESGFPSAHHASRHFSWRPVRPTHVPTGRIGR